MRQMLFLFYKINSLLPKCILPGVAKPYNVYKFALNISLLKKSQTMCSKFILYVVIIVVIIYFKY